MARYTLHEEQREVVENALLLYESELEKLKKKPGLLTKEVNEHLAVLHGTEEEPGLLRIFARDVPEQMDAFYDRERPEEDLDETLEGIEEEAERRIAAQAEEEAGENENEPEEETDEQEEMELAADEGLVDGITDDPEPEEYVLVDRPGLIDLDIDECFAALRKTLPLGVTAKMDDEEMIERLVDFWTVHDFNGEPPTPEWEVAPRGGFYHKQADGSYIRVLVLPDAETPKFYFGTFDVSEPPTASGAALCKMIRNALEDDPDARPPEADLDDLPSPFEYLDDEEEKGEEQAVGPKIEVGQKVKHTADLRRNFQVATVSSDRIGVEDSSGTLVGYAPVDALSWDENRKAWLYAGEDWLDQPGEGEVEGASAETPRKPERVVVPATGSKTAQELMEFMEKYGNVLAEDDPYGEGGPIKLASGVEAERRAEAKAQEQEAQAGAADLASPFDDDEGEDGVPAHLRGRPMHQRTCLECFEDFGPDGKCPSCGEQAPWAEEVAAGA